MAREIVKARNQSVMWDKLNRAARIVLCVQGLGNPLISSLQLTDGFVVSDGNPAPPPTPTNLASLLACTSDPSDARARLAEMGGFLVHP
jgi:hypothetical protein